jgi:hypothetical protein
VVKAWKAILAALVIFAAGVVTGGLTVRLKLGEVVPPSAPLSSGPLRPRGELMERMQRQLYLTPPQRERIEQILRESHDRMKQLWDSIAPQAQEEHRRVNDRIRAELTPEQQSRFEELLKARTPKNSFDERRRRDDRREPKPARKSDTSGVSAPWPDGQDRRAR